MDETKARFRAYWRANLRMTCALLLLWAAASFLPGWFAEQLDAEVIFGWPVGFYMAAQGSLIIFLFIVWFYDRWMMRLERRFGMGKGDE